MGKLNLLGGQIPTQLNCYLPPCNFTNAQQQGVYRKSDEMKDS